MPVYPFSSQVIFLHVFMHFVLFCLVHSISSIGLLTGSWVKEPLTIGKKMSFYFPATVNCPSSLKTRSGLVGCGWFQPCACACAVKLLWTSEYYSFMMLGRQCHTTHHPSFRPYILSTTYPSPRMFPVKSDTDTLFLAERLAVTILSNSCQLLVSVFTTVHCRKKPLWPMLTN